MSEESDGATGEARREFLTKAAAALGALAAVGLASGVLGKAAEAGVTTIRPMVAPRLAVGQKVDLQEAALRYEKLGDGHAVEMSSAELTNVLAREGLISKDLMGKQALMRVEVRYSL